MWWRGYYGSYKDMTFTRLDGTYSRKDIIERARAIAKEHNVRVTIIGEKGTRLAIQTVGPDGSIGEHGSISKEVEKI